MQRLTKQLLLSTATKLSRRFRYRRKAGNPALFSHGSYLGDARV